MPTVDVAMARSLGERTFREGAANLLAAALRPALQGRNTISNSVQDVQTAFSSWDNCMQVAYCKWPVIGVMIVGGLIILSVVWCIIRCACCAKACCCECFHCLKCCGSCCGCCDAPQKPSKHLDDPYHAPQNQPYHQNAPMTTGLANKSATGFSAPNKSSTGFSAPEPPQYAEFDVSKKGPVSEDALPEMPSWDQSGNKKVALDDGVEMDQLNKPATTAAAAASSSQSMPLMVGAQPNSGAVSPISPSYRGVPYGGQQQHADSTPYLAGGNNGQMNPYGNSNGQGYGYDNGSAYGQQSAVSLDQGYGAAGMGMAGPGRRPSGNSNYGGGYGQGRGFPGNMSRQPSRDNYGGMNGPQGYGPGMNGQGRNSPASAGMNGPGRNSPALGMMPPSRTQSPAQRGGPYGQPGPRRSPAPPQDYGYGNGGGNGAYDRPSYGHQQRQYSSDSTRPLAQSRPSESDTRPPPAQMSLQNNSGFDFSGSAYSRPQDQAQSQSQGGYDEGLIDSYATNQGYDRRPTNPSRQNTGGSYPGYKPYQPGDNNASQGQQGWSGV